MAVLAAPTTTALSPQVGAQLILTSLPNKVRPIPARLVGAALGAPILNAAPTGGGVRGYAIG